MMYIQKNHKDTNNVTLEIDPKDTHRITWKDIQT